MTTTMKKALVPAYLTSFQCIGPACEDSCCSAWRIHIDKPTYKKYVNLRQSPFSFEVKKKLKRNRNGSDTRYAQIILEANKACPFQSKEGWCGMQQAYGEEYLSNTCRNYPRIHNYVDNRVEISTTLSCPEAARMVLLNSEGLVFEEKEVPIVPADYFSLIINQKQMAEPKYHSLHDLRLFVMSLLQYRVYTIEERLWILGMFIHELEPLINQPEQVSSVMLKYVQRIENLSYKGMIEKLPTHETFLLNWFSLLYRAALRNFANHRYMECFREFQQGFHLSENDERSVKELGDLYTERKRTYYKPFIKEHEYLLENYAVHYAFQQLLPYGKRLSPFQQYMQLIINITLIKIHLIGMSGHHEGLNPELAVKLIQSLVKRLEHSDDLMRSCMKSLDEMGLQNMAAASICLRT